MLFPNLSPQYLDEVDKPLLGRMEAFYSEAITINQSFWGEADTDVRFEMGDQSLWNDLYGNLPANRRRQFSFNRIRRVVNMISGHQRRNRKSTIVQPIENADADTADQFTKIIMWINQQEGVLETISDAFRGSLVTGMNLLHVWVDYRSDPISGNLRVDNCSYNSFLIDPYFRKTDLSDCNGLWKRTYITKREALSLLPEHTEEIIGLMPAQQNRDGKFQFLPESYAYAQRNLMTYDEFYYRDFRTQKCLCDTQTGEVLEWRSQDEDRLKLFLQTYPQVTLIEQEIPTVKLAIVLQGKVMYHDVNPTGSDSYPFVPVLAYYTPESPYFPYRVQGVVRGLRDAQYLYNRRRVIELDILESQISSGFKYKENALVNPEDIFMSGQGKGLALKQEAQMTDVEQIMPPQVPPSMIQLSELLAKEVEQISGVSEELLGSAVDDKAGILSMLRQGAGLTTLQGLFDNLDHAQKLLGKIMLDIIQANFAPGKVKKILSGKEPTPQFYNKAFGKYDCAIEEGLNTTTQKQMQFAQMLHLREVGVPIPDENILEACTLQNKKEVIAAIQNAQKAQQEMRQQQEQAALREQLANIQLVQARATADQGLGLERLSRIQENKALAVERRAAAAKDEDAALLNLVKALKEVEGIDIANLEKLLTLSQLVERNQSTLQPKAEVPAPAVASQPLSAAPSAGATP